MGTFLDVQREITAAAAQGNAAPGSCKRPQLADPISNHIHGYNICLAAACHQVLVEESNPHRLHGDRVSIHPCCRTGAPVDGQGTQGFRGAYPAQGHPDSSSRACSSSQTSRGCKDQVQAVDGRNQPDTPQLPALREQVQNLELELRATQDHVDTLTKEKMFLTERTKALESQSAKILARCKALVTENNALQ